MKTAYFHKFDQQLSTRLLQTKRNCGTILLQGLSFEMGLSIVFHAWLNGLTVAIIREDAHLDYCSFVRELLEDHLFVLTNNSGDVVVRFDDKIVSYSSWLAGDGFPTDGVSGAENDAEPYCWSADECALILFTSGSTGTPKGVCHSLGSIRRSVALFAHHFDLRTGTDLLCLAPCHTMSGFRSMVLPLFTDVQVSFLPHDCNSFPAIVNFIRQSNPAKIVCGPVFIDLLAAYSERLIESLKGVDALLSTGAELNERNRRHVENIFTFPVINYYGLTETGGIVLAETKNTRNYHMLPPPCHGVRTKLIPFKGTENIYRLSIMCRTLFLGYVGDTLLCREEFDTGDLVRKCNDGQLELVGRVSGAFKASNTEWIFPNLLERWLKFRTDLFLDVVVVKNRMSVGNGIEVHFECQKPPDLGQLEKRIVKELGAEYRPATWKLAKIDRSILGKVDCIC